MKRSEIFSAVKNVILDHQQDVDCWGNIECSCGAVFYEDIKHPGKADEEHLDHLVLRVVANLEVLLHENDAPESLPDISWQAPDEEYGETHQDFLYDYDEAEADSREGQYTAWEIIDS